MSKTKTKTVKKAESDHKHVAVWMSGADKQALAGAVRRANEIAGKGDVPVRYNASSILRQLLRAYVDGRIAVPGLPSLAPEPAAEQTPAEPPKAVAG